MNIVPAQLLELPESPSNCKISVYSHCHLCEICTCSHSVIAYQPWEEGVLKKIAKAHAKYF